VRRLGAARGWSHDEASRRLSVQRPSEAFEDAADLTLDNGGTRGSLEERARTAVAGAARAHRDAFPTSGKEPC